MKYLITIAILVTMGYLLAIPIASEFGGEVVQLETRDERGGNYATSLWIVDAYGDVWLRAGDPGAAWLQRLRRDPQVFVTRNGTRQAYRAEIVEDFADRINDAMRDKYGWADEVIAMIHDSDEVVAIRILEE